VNVLLKLAARGPQCHIISTIGTQSFFYISNGRFGSIMSKRALSDKQIKQNQTKAKQSKAVSFKRRLVVVGPWSLSVVRSSLLVAIYHTLQKQHYDLASCHHLEFLLRESTKIHCVQKKTPTHFFLYRLSPWNMFRIIL